MIRCSHCHADCMDDDLYCRQCGADLTVPSVSLVPTQSAVPALLQNPQVSRSVAAGVGAIALGVGLELLRRNVLARLTQPSRSVGRALPILDGMKDILMPRNDKPLKLPRGYEVHETVVYIRRVIRRED